MYRIVKKITKKTEYKCLECNYHKFIEQNFKHYYVECLAPNKCISGEFDCKDLYCEEIKGFNDMTVSEVEKIKEKHQEMEDEKNFKIYARKYFTKKEAKRMIDNYKN